ncbi:hypothetical protein GCM10022377_13640 [Zhihengliuella alba]|uniref:Uncharacterized protein n=1 Tax=Zhihengliuella alba TaxID=547018 RepID=A0ABP7D9S8_9MICC
MPRRGNGPMADSVIDEASDTTRVSLDFSAGLRTDVAGRSADRHPGVHDASKMEKP